ncbi:lipoprotein [Streptomyces omiyaensis]|uniref:CASTOR/POLLUX-related putative ion channel n=1 Tax=Streptomyces omiyaensis TaxID=68247 RepID=UPI00167ADF19|nr:NAD-binding lipoprotein [Streptomyces omiyaensis]GGY70325.1 lipoprotein [Streptomyces omiyaensis]
MPKERAYTVPAQRAPGRTRSAPGPAARAAGPPARPGPRDRLRYWIDRTVVRGVPALSAWLALACLGLVAPASALLVWTDSKAPDTLQGKAATIWRTVGQTLRLGGEVGPPLRMVLSVFLALVSLLYVSFLVGIVTTALTDRLAELERGQTTVVERGHTLVLGWSEQAPTVVAELLAAHAQRGRGAVVVLADRDKAEMERELRDALPPRARVRLLCRRGRPADPAALARVTPAAAGAVVVLPPDAPGADGQVIRTLLALRAAVGEGCPVQVVAAVRDGAHLPTARLAAGPGAVVLDVDDLAARLLVQCVLEPGLALVLEDLLDFAGAELHALRPPGLAGRRFGELAAACPDSCAVGIVRGDGTPHLAPPPETLMAPGDALLVLAEDHRATILPAGPGPGPGPGPGAEPAAPVAPERPVAVPGAVPAAAGCAARGDVPPVAGPRRALVLGWNRRGERVTEGLARCGIAAVRDEAAGRAVRTEGYDHVVVLAGPDGEEHHDPDGAALVALLHLRERARESGRSVPVAAELTDARNRPLAPAGPRTDLLLTGRLAALLMAQVAQDGRLAAAFDELFAPAGPRVRLRPVTDFVPPGTEASFATLAEAAARNGAAALGYRLRNSPRPRLNPPGGGVRRWSPGDLLVVVDPS